MAIVKFGGGVTGIRGMLGGNLFTANAAGAYVRAWANIKNPRTLNQTFMRAYTAAAPNLWAALSDGQRTDWNDYGDANPLTNPLGETYYRTGFQWFIHCNNHLQRWGVAPIQDAPVSPAPSTVSPDALQYEHTGGSDECKITFQDSVFAGVWCLLSAFVIPYGVNMTWPSNYYLLRHEYDIQPGTTELSFFLAHIIKFSDPEDGWKIFVRVHTGDTQGLVSAPWEASAVWTTS